MPVATYDNEYLRFLNDHPRIIWIVAILVVLLILAIMVIIIFVVNRHCTMIENVFGVLKGTATHCVSKVCTVLKNDALPLLLKHIPLKEQQGKNDNVDTLKIGKGTDKHDK